MFRTPERLKRPTCPPPPFPSRTGRELEEVYLDEALVLAEEFDVPVVATNDVRFLDRTDFEAHEARVCIHDGRTLADPRRSRAYSDQQFLRSPQEMATLFADLPGCIENSVEIARRCNLELELGESYLPRFPVPEGHDVETWFVARAREGLDERLAWQVEIGLRQTSDVRDEYDERLRTELDVIVGMGFPGYFLIVADFIRWAREQRCAGRAWVAAPVPDRWWPMPLGITDLDPISLRPAVRALPESRARLDAGLRRRLLHGGARPGHRLRQRALRGYRGRRRARIAQIITFGTMAAKAVVRDVGRVQGHPYGFVDQLAKLIPFEVGMTLDKALEQEEAAA